MLKTWNEFFTEQKFTKADILSKGFIFSKFPEFFNDISIYPDNDQITTEEQKTIYDIDLFNELSERYVPSNIEKLVTFYDSFDYEQFVKVLMVIINRSHYSNWVKIYKDFMWEYDHGSNYDLTETRTVSHTGDITRVATNTGTVKDIGTDTTETDNKLTANKTDNTRYGFNSTEAVPTDSSTNSNEQEGSSTVNIDRTTTNDLTNNATDTYNTTDTESITRVGDLSVRAIQDTLQIDINLWKANVFYNIVLDNILSTLSLSILKGGE